MSEKERNIEGMRVNVIYSYGVFWGCVGYLSIIYYLLYIFRGRFILVLLVDWLLMGICFGLGVLSTLFVIFIFVL